MTVKKREFDVFLSELKDTNTTLDFFSDFDKISKKVDEISLKLNQLNYLIGKDNLHDAIHNLWKENSKVFSILDVLIAVRKADKKSTLNNNNEVCLIESFFETPEGVIEFIDNTGLKDVFSNKLITNLVDYVFGIETGLDTNARKNRSGHIMENTISGIFDKNGIPYKKEISSTELEGITSLGGDIKRFDYVIETKEKTFLIEVNFYGTSGSKLNETARSYSDIAPKINKYPTYEFVWITDGKGWFSAKSKLEEAFNVIPRIYNLTSINDFIKEIKSKI